MKNLIITSGIIIFMMTVMIFQSDCARIRHMNQQLKWAAEDICASLPVSDKETEQILERYFDGNVEYRIEEGEDGHTIVSLYSQPIDMNLDILDGYLRIHCEKRAPL